MASSIFDIAAQASPDALDFLEPPLSAPKPVTPAPTFRTLLDNAITNIPNSSVDWSSWEKKGIVPPLEAAQSLKLAEDKFGPLESWDRETIRAWEPDITSVNEYYRRMTKNDEGQSQGMLDYLNDIEAFGKINRFTDRVFKVDDATGEKMIKPEAFEALAMDRKQGQLLSLVDHYRQNPTTGMNIETIQRETPVLGYFVRSMDTTDTMEYPRLMAKFEKNEATDGELRKLAQIIAARTNVADQLEDSTFLRGYRTVTDIIAQAIEFGATAGGVGKLGTAAARKLGSTVAKKGWAKTGKFLSESSVPSGALTVLGIPLFSGTTHADVRNRYLEHGSFANAAVDGYVTKAIESGVEMWGGHLLTKAGGGIKNLFNKMRGKTPAPKLVVESEVMRMAKETGVYSSFFGELAEEHLLQEPISGFASLASGRDWGGFGLTGKAVSGEFGQEEFEQLLFESLAIGTMGGAMRLSNRSAENRIIDHYAKMKGIQIGKGEGQRTRDSLRKELNDLDVSNAEQRAKWFVENLHLFPAMYRTLAGKDTMSRSQWADTMAKLGIPGTSKEFRDQVVNRAKELAAEPEAPLAETPVAEPTVAQPAEQPAPVEPIAEPTPQPIDAETAALFGEVESLEKTDDPTQWATGIKEDPNLQYDEQNFLETLPGDQRAEAGLARLRPDAAGQPVRVFQGIILDKSNRNKGRGQWMILNELAQNPEHWYWNSQAFDPLAKSLSRLKDDGLIDLTIRLRQGGEFTAKITEKGKQYVEKRRQGVFDSVNKEFQSVRAELDALLDKVEAGNERLERTLRDNRRVLESVNFLPPEAFKLGGEGYKILSEYGVHGKTINAIRQEMEAGEKLKPQIAPLQEKWNTLSAQAREMGMRGVDISKGLPDAPAQESQPEIPDHENPLFTQPQKNILPDQTQQGAVPIDMLGRMVGAGKKFWKKYFTSIGDIPAPIFEEKLVRDGRFAKLQKQIEFSLRALNKGKKEVFGSKNIPEAENAKLNAALKGQIPLTQLPEPLRAPILRMRNEIDALSRLMQQNGMVQGDLALTFANNEGSYLHRAYRIFHEPRFAEKIPDANKNAVRAYLRQEFPNWTDNQIEQTLGELMFRGEESPSIPGLIRGSSLGEKDLTALFKRKDIAPEIRALWGEYQDPAVNYAHSLHKMGRMIANHQFLENVATQFYGTFFWQKDDPDINPRAVTAMDDTNSMSPLNGLYTLPEIKEAFEQQGVGKLDDGFMDGMLRAYLKAISLPKYTKTVLSHITHIRNFLSNVTVSIANGHIPNVQNLWKATQATAFQTFSGKNDAQMEAYAERLAELGITGESIHAGELKGIFRDSEKAAIDEILGKNKTDKIRKSFDKIAELYQAEDTFWKIYQFEMEKAQYMEADPSLTEADAELIAARIVSNQTPTYSRIPKGLKNLRYLPFAPFINFQVEMWRVTKNIATQASKELQDPNLRKIGAKRVAGLLVGVSAFEVLAQGLMAAFGITGDDDEDVRLFIPEWSKHSAFGYTKNPHGGGVEGFDFSYMDPFDTIKRPIRALFGGEDKGLVEATKEIFRPFGNEGLFTSRVIDIMRNAKMGGAGEVYNPQDSFGKKLGAIVWHLYEGIEPGTLTAARRGYDAAIGRIGTSGKAPTVGKELLANMTGMRPAEFSIPQSLFYQSSAFVNDTRDAEQILRRPATNKGTVSDSELASAYLRSENARRALFDGMQNRVEAALRLGVPEAEIRESLEKGRVSKSDIEDLFSGTYRAYVPTQIGPRQVEVLSLAMQNANEETRRQVTGEIAYAATSPTDSEDQQAAAAALMQAEGISYSEVREILREEFLRRSEKKRLTPAFAARLEKLGRVFRSK